MNFPYKRILFTAIGFALGYTAFTDPAMKEKASLLTARVVTGTDLSNLRIFPDRPGKIYARATSVKMDKLGHGQLRVLRGSPLAEHKEFTLITDIGEERDGWVEIKSDRLGIGDRIVAFKPEPAAPEAAAMPGTPSPAAVAEPVSVAVPIDP